MNDDDVFVTASDAVFLFLQLFFHGCSMGKIVFNS